MDVWDSGRDPPWMPKGEAEQFVPENGFSLAAPRARGSGDRRWSSTHRREIRSSGCWQGPLGALASTGLQSS